MEYNSISNATIYIVNNINASNIFIISVVSFLKLCHTKLKISIITLLLKIIVFCSLIYSRQLSFNDSLYVYWLTKPFTHSGLKLKVYRTLSENTKAAGEVSIWSLHSSNDSNRKIYPNEAYEPQESKLRYQMETSDDEEEMRIITDEEKNSSYIFCKIKTEKNNEWKSKIENFTEKLLEYMEKIQEWMEGFEKEWVIDIYNDWIENMSTKRIDYIDSWTQHISHKWTKYIKESFNYENKLNVKSMDDKEEEELQYFFSNPKRKSESLMKNNEKRKEELKKLKELKKCDLKEIKDRINKRKKELDKYKENNKINTKRFKKKKELAEEELFRYWTEKIERIWKEKIKNWMEIIEKYTKTMEICMDGMEKNDLQIILVKWTEDLNNFLETTGEVWMQDIESYIKNIEKEWIKKMNEEWDELIKENSNRIALIELENILSKENKHLLRKKREWKEKKMKIKTELGMKKNYNFNIKNFSKLIQEANQKCISIKNFIKKKKEEYRINKKEKNKKEKKEEINKNEKKKQKKIEEKIINISEIQLLQKKSTENPGSILNKWLEGEVIWKDMSKIEKDCWLKDDKELWETWINLAYHFSHLWEKWEILLEIENERNQSIQKDLNKLKEILRRSEHIFNVLDESDWTKKTSEVEWKYMNETEWIINKTQETDNSINLQQKKMKDIKENKILVNSLKKCEETGNRFKEEFNNLQKWLRNENRWENSLRRGIREFKENLNLNEIIKSEKWKELIAWLNNKDEEWKKWFHENLKNLNEWECKAERKEWNNFMSNDRHKLMLWIDNECMEHVLLFETIKKDQEKITDKMDKELEHLLSDNYVLKKLLKREFKTWSKWSKEDKNEENWEELKQCLRNNEEKLKLLEESVKTYEDKKKKLSRWFERDECTWDEKKKYVETKIVEWKESIKFLENNKKIWENMKKKWNRYSNNNNNDKLKYLSNTMEYLEWMKDKKNMLKESFIRNSQEMLDLFMWVENKKCVESLINEKIMEDIEAWKYWKSTKDKLIRQSEYTLSEKMLRNFVKLLWLIDKEAVKKIEKLTGEGVKIKRLDKRYVSPIRPMLKMMISTYNETRKNTITAFENIFKSYEWTLWKELKILDKEKKFIENVEKKMKKIKKSK
ncbi:hypothetical protein PRELSG_0400100 [Plasmodium relictum]|uniref:Uncharacterized protein n=1 Tax=Plasmodium relictum TaxID=85471 RepID=A0A1J1H1X0_PLARL|nr:hypothetical protein PRELSG_0400100 [Plasmodium relictum]CRG98653.1 hypothetical protein PRELSG_0400100 [Plasmodium relictum]